MIDAGTQWEIVGRLALAASLVRHWPRAGVPGVSGRRPHDGARVHGISTLSPICRASTAATTA